MPLLEPESEHWDWYKVRKSRGLEGLDQYPVFILWNSGDGLRLALPKGSRPPGEGWLLARSGEPRARPAVPLTLEDLRLERLLGAVVLSPVPYAEVLKHYGRFMASYRRVQVAGGWGALEELERARVWWEEAEKGGFRVYVGYGLRFPGSGEVVRAGLLARVRVGELEERARKGDEGARRAWERLLKPAERLLEARPRRLGRGRLALTHGQLERLLRALSVAYREDRGGAEVFLAEDFSIAVQLGSGNNNLLVVGESQTGKSTLVGCLLAQLSESPWGPETILVFDWTGEYTFLEGHGFRVLEALDPVCNPLALGPRVALGILEEAAYEHFQSERGRLSPPVAEQAEKALMEAFEAGGGGTLVDVVRSLRVRAQRARSEDERTAALAALRRIWPLLHPALCAREWALPQGRVVVDLSRLPDERVKRAVTLTMLRMVYASAGRWRGLIVVDEIHSYIVPTPAGPDCPTITLIANQLSKHGVAIWAVGQQYHLVPSGLQGARAIVVFRQTHAEALRAVAYSLGSEAVEIVRSLPPRRFYLFADCSVPAVRAPPPVVERVAPRMVERRRVREGGQLDFTAYAARFGVDYAELVELYVKYLPHARALARFAARRASPEELAEVRSLNLEAREAMMLGELYAARGYT